MCQGQRQGDSLSADELGTFQLASALQITGFLQNLVQSAHLFGLFQKQADGFLEILKRPLFCAAARRDIQFGGVSHVCPALSENLGGELYLHTSMVNECEDE